MGAGNLVEFGSGLGNRGRQVMPTPRLPETDIASADRGRINASIRLVAVRYGNNQVMVLVGGEIDLRTAPALDAALDRARWMARAVRRRTGTTEVVVDLRPVEFLGAAGLTALIRAHRRCSHETLSLCVVADQNTVVTPLRLTGLDQTLGLRVGLVR